MKILLIFRHLPTNSCFLFFASFTVYFSCVWALLWHEPYSFALSYISRIFPPALSIDVNCKVCKPSWLTSHRRWASVILGAAAFSLLLRDTAQDAYMQIRWQKYIWTSHRVAAFKHANWSKFLQSARLSFTPTFQILSKYIFIIVSYTTSWNIDMNDRVHLQQFLNDSEINLTHSFH